MRCVGKAMLAACLVLGAPCLGGGAEPGERRPAVGLSRANSGVTVEADTLEYQREGKILAARGDVRVTFEGRSLRADTVEVNLEEERLWAEGRVVLVEGESRLEGETLGYHYREQTGVLTRGRGFLAPATHFEGAEIRKDGERLYRITRGAFTACRICQPEPESPDWEFRAWRVTIVQDDMVYATWATLWIRGIPVLASPFAAFPIGPRRTGFLIPRVGYGNRAGFAVHQPFFWVLSSSQDITLTGGYRTKRGPEFRGEYRYLFSETSEGKLEGKYLRDREKGAPDRDRASVLWRHDQEIRPGLTAKADVNYQTDKELERSLVENSVEQRTRRVIESTAFLTQTWPRFSLEALTGVSRDLSDTADTRVVQLPEVRFAALSQPLGPTPLLFSVSSSATYFERNKGVDVSRADLFPFLSLPLRFSPWVTATPHAGFRETAYSKRGDGESNGTDRGLFVLGATAETRVSRSFSTGTTWVGEILHEIEPRVQYQYIPERNQRHLPQIDSVDFVSPQNRVTYSVTTRLLTRRRENGEQTEGAGGREILSLTLSQGLNLHPRERDFSDLFLAGLTPERVDQAVTNVRPGSGGFSVAKERRLSNLVGAVTIAPLPMVSLRGLYAFNTEQNRQDGTNTSLRFTVPEWGYLEGGQSFVRGQGVEGYLASLGLGPFRGLSLGFRTRYDGVRGTTLENGVILTYRTCCWQLDVSYTNRPPLPGVRGGENDVRVTFELLTGRLEAPSSPAK